MTANQIVFRAFEVSCSNRLCFTETRLFFIN